MRNKRILLMLVLILAAFVMASAAAYGAGSSALTVTILDESENPVSGVTVELYHVTEPELQDAEGIDGIIEVFEYIWSENKHGITETTGTDGKVTFSGLEDGLYMVFDRGGQAVYFEPFLVKFPYGDPQNPITHVYAKPKTSESSTMAVHVTKKWDDNNNAAGKRPENVIVCLVMDDVAIATATLNEENNWKHNFAGLNKEKEYTVTEFKVKDYETSYSGSQETGYVITNKYNGTTDPGGPGGPGDPDDPYVPPVTPDDPDIPDNPDDPENPEDPEEPSEPGIGGGEDEPEEEMPEENVPKIPQTGANRMQAWILLAAGALLAAGGIVAYFCCQRKLIVLSVCGALMIAGSAGMFAAYDREEWEAEHNTEIVLQQVHVQMAENAKPYDVQQKMEDFDLLYGNPMGILEIEQLELELPILEKWNYELLTVAPCRYSGSVEERNLILLGHNYNRHFGTLKKLQAGDEMIFHDMKGRTFCYEVKLTETLESTQLEELITSGYDLSIFTCTPGGQKRVVVRADLVTVDGVRI